MKRDRKSRLKKRVIETWRRKDGGGQKKNLEHCKLIRLQHDLTLQLKNRVKGQMTTTLVEGWRAEPRRGLEGRLGTREGGRRGN